MSTLDRPLRIMHTAAHPADAFDTVGGTLAHHIRRGDEVCVVVFSHGVRSHALDVIESRRLQGDAIETVDQSISRKEKEVVDACHILGIEDVRFLRYEDDILLVEKEHIRTVARIIREFKPDVIITHSPYEMAGIAAAHRVCCETTLLARSMAHGIMEDDSEPHNVGEVFYMWHHGETSSLDYFTFRFPEILIDVTDVVHLKVKALDCLKSQYYSGSFGRKVIENSNGIHGVHMCVPYCEVFVRHYPQVEEYLPVCQHNMNIASQPLEQTYDRMGQFIVPNVPFDEGD